MDHNSASSPVAFAPQGTSDEPLSSPGGPNGIVLRFDVRALTLLFVAIEVVLAVTFILIVWFRLLDHAVGSMFNMDHEGNIPSWFSGTMFFLAAIPAAVRGLQMRHANRSSPYRIYLVAAAGLTFLSMDEVGQVHDKIDRILALGLYTGVGLTILVVLRREAIALLCEKAGRRSLIGGVVSVVFGAVIMDFSPNKWWTPERAVEEFSEMFGATLLFFGFASRVRPFGVVVVASKKAPLDADSAQNGLDRPAAVGAGDSIHRQK